MPHENCSGCLKEITKKAINLSITDKEKQLQLLDKYCNYIDNNFDEIKLPDVSTFLFREIAKATGVTDPFLDVKITSNQMFLKILPMLKETFKIENKKQALYNLFLYSIAANMVDFSTGGHSVDIVETINNIIDFPEEGLAVDNYDSLFQLIQKSDSIIYLTDNCGEVVVDNLVVEYLVNYLGKEIYFGLKGSPVANDCTIIDFQRDGLEKTATENFIVSNSFGWNYNETTNRFKELLNRVDLLIVKGQSNYETTLNNLVRHSDMNFPPIFCILRTKCEVITNHLGVSLGSNVIKQMYPLGEKIKVHEIVDY